jgi:hypothetical protein
VAEGSTEQDLPARRSGPSWRAEAEAWIRAAAESHERVVTGAIEVHKLRFWAVVLRVPTDRGPLWFKENAPSQAFEAALMADLARLVPDAVPPVVATEPGRGWLLTEDLGVPMADDPALADPAAALGALTELVGSFSALQRQLATQGAAMRAAGVPFFDDGNAMAYAVALADQLARLPLGDVRRLDADDRRLVDGGLRRLGEACAMLEASGLPDSLDHNDLHLANAFRRGPGTIAVIDLGDAVWSHPLTTMRIPSWIAASRLAGPPGSPAHERIVESALDPWTDLAPPAALRRLLPAAERVSCLHRAESWRRLIADVPIEVVPEQFRAAPKEWLLTALAPDPFEDAMAG